MPYKGRVENGVIVAEEHVDLPEGTEVEFRPIKLPAGRHHPDVERFAGVIGPETGEKQDYLEHLRKKHA